MVFYFIYGLTTLVVNCLLQLRGLPHLRFLFSRYFGFVTFVVVSIVHKNTILMGSTRV